MEQQDLLENHDAQEHATKLQDIHSLIQAEKSFAQAKQQENADRHHNPAPAYQVGDLVWLNARNMIKRCPSVQLNYIQLGSFPILVLSPQITRAGQSMLDQSQLRLSFASTTTCSWTVYSPCLLCLILKGT
jgi:hypothetical protein